MNEVRGFKVFNPDWTCDPTGHDPKQYTCPGKFEEEVEIYACGHGMHFCENVADCFNYYSFNPDNKVAEVIAYGDIVREGDKCCTNKIKIVREIPWQELLTIVNTGNDCTGLCNTGDWNKSSFNAGCFNTEESTIMLFNKPSKWTYRDWLNSDARYLLMDIPKDVVEWVYENYMTEEEKKAHPSYKTTGGYLKVLDESECAQIWWNDLSETDRNKIKSIPNFDIEIFEQCTGIKIESEGK